MQKRIQWIDSVKGIALLLVIMSHIDYVSKYHFDYMYYGFMAVFFIMSGYTNKPSTSFSKVIRSKSQRLLIPYIFYGLAGIFVALVTVKDLYLEGSLLGLIYGRWSVFPDISSDNCILMLGHCHTISPLWFFLSLFVAYILIFVYDVSGRFKSLFLTLLILLSSASAFKQTLFPWSLDTAPIAALFIVFGRYFAKNSKEEYRKKTTLAAFFTLLFAVYFLLCYCNGSPNLSIGHFGLHGVWSVFIYMALGIAETLMLCCISILVDNNFIGRLLSYFGRHSLRLICIHWIIYDVTLRCVPY